MRGSFIPNSAPAQEKDRTFSRFALSFYSPITLLRPQWAVQVLYVDGSMSNVAVSNRTCESNAVVMCPIEMCPIGSVSNRSVSNWFGVQYYCVQ